MAVTKRTRFEVLKRDNHTCRYCGASAPDATLHVDHVIPVALGGSDRPDNLVAACKDCNAGKTSTSADDATVAEVKDEALAYATALRAKIKEVIGSAKGLRKIRLNLEQYWWDEAKRNGYYTPPQMDANWSQSLRRWLALGLDESFLQDAIDITMSKRGLRRGEEFKYFCGVIYRTLDEVHAQVQSVTAPRRVDEDGHPLPDSCGHCNPCKDNRAEECALLAGHYCEECGSEYCTYAFAYEDGQIDEHMRAYNAGLQHRTTGRCGHCPNCIDSTEDNILQCKVHHELKEGESAYFCFVCGRQDCYYGWGFRAGLTQNDPEWREMVLHYRSCTEVKHG